MGASRFPRQRPHLRDHCTGRETQGMVKLTPDQQREFVRGAPGMFVPAAGAWGRGGCTMVQFAAADARDASARR